MNDPWDLDAQFRIARQAASEAAYSELQAATSELATFMQERGPAEWLTAKVDEYARRVTSKDAPHPLWTRGIFFILSLVAY